MWYHFIELKKYIVIFLMDLIIFFCKKRLDRETTIIISPDVRRISHQDYEYSKHLFIIIFLYPYGGSVKQKLINYLVISSCHKLGDLWVGLMDEFRAFVY